MAQILRAAKKASKSKPKIFNPSDKQKYLERQAKKMDNKPTAPENAFIEILKSLKLKYETQKIINGKIFDFYIPDKNAIFEIDGNYWHGYGLKITEMNEIQVKAFKNDQLKEGIAKGMGFHFFRIWEHELEDEKFEDTKEKVRKIIKDLP